MVVLQVLSMFRGECPGEVRESVCCCFVVVVRQSVRSFHCLRLSLLGSLVGVVQCDRRFVVVYPAL